MRQRRRALGSSRLWLTARSRALEDSGHAPPLVLRRRHNSCHSARTGPSRGGEAAQAMKLCQSLHRDRARITPVLIWQRTADAAVRAARPQAEIGERRSSAVTTSVGRMQETSTCTRILCARTVWRRVFSIAQLARFTTSSLCDWAVLAWIRRISELYAKAAIAGGPRAVNDL
jgi:hypothetical protein